MSGLLDGLEHRKEFVARQVERGYDVAGWVESLPLKIKEDWLLHLNDV